MVLKTEIGVLKIDRNGCIRSRRALIGERKRCTMTGNINEVLDRQKNLGKKFLGGLGDFKRLFGLIRAVFGDMATGARLGILRFKLAGFRGRATRSNFRVKLLRMN